MPALKSAEGSKVNYPLQNPVIESRFVSLFSTITVNINEPCDEEWRNKYPTTWAYEANRAVERADDGLYTNFGIDYISVAQNTWSSSSTTAPDLVEEAKDEIGLTNGADMMIAFSNQQPGVGGYTFDFNEPYIIVFDQGYSSNSEVVQHESGHAYDLRHCTSDCVMHESEYGHIDEFCSTHETEWEDNKNRY